MKVKVFPFVKGQSHGNIIWCDRLHGSAYYRTSQFAMRGGKFPTSHPVGGDRCKTDGSQLGSGPGIDAFRERGYWASCFPEGDGITWEPINEQSFETTLKDIRECFGWEIEG